METLYHAIRLRVVSGGAVMLHSKAPDETAPQPGSELRTVI